MARHYGITVFKKYISPRFINLTLKAHTSSKWLKHTMNRINKATMDGEMGNARKTLKDLNKVGLRLASVFLLQCQFYTN